MISTFLLCCRLLAHVWRGQRKINRFFEGFTQQQRMDAIRQWSQELLRILGVELKVNDLREPQDEATQPHGMLVVCNHISWLDIFVINAWQPMTFVSKSEIAKWPVLGPLVTGAGTLYIQREKRRDAHKVVQQIAESLQTGHHVAIFPEGTTSDGFGLLHFHANLLQAPVSVNAPVQPLTMRYIDSQTRERTREPAYVGDMNLLQSMAKLANYAKAASKQSHIVAEITVLPQQRGDDRRKLSASLRSEMARSLGFTDEETNK